MAIPNYTRPQLTIRQNLEVTASGTLDRQNALVIGPQYHVSEADLETRSTDFSSSEFQVPYDSDTLSNYTIDEESVKLFAEGLESSLADWKFFLELPDDGNILQLKDGSGPIIMAGVGAGVLEDGTTNLLNGRDVQPGDIVYITPTRGIDKVNVLNGGTGYDANHTTLEVVGDGTGAVATPIIVGGVIRGVTVNSTGSGYTMAKVLVKTDVNFEPTVDATLALPDNFFQSGYRRMVTGLKGVDEASQYSIPAETTMNPVAAGSDQIVDAPTNGNFAVSRNATTSTSYDGLAKGPTVSGKYGDDIVVTVVGVIDENTIKVNFHSRSGYYDAANVIMIRTGDQYAYDPALFSGFDGLNILITKKVTGGPNLTLGDVVEFSIRGKYIPLTYYNSKGEVSSISVVDGGADYVEETSSVIITGNGSGAEALAEFERKIVKADLTAGGGNYVDPQVAIVDPTNQGSGAVITAQKEGKVLKTVVANGGTGYVEPTIEVSNHGDGEGAAFGVKTEGKLLEVAIDEAGTGYTDGTYIINDGNVSDPGGQGAGIEIEVTVSGGLVTATSINAAGTGYHKDTILAFGESTTGTEAILSGTFGGAVTEVLILSTGTGYDEGTTLAVSEGTSATPTAASIDVTIGGAITGLTIESAGSAYDPASTITITDNDVDGGAGATGAIAVGGAVTGITIVTKGSGYTIAEVLVADTGTYTPANCSVTLGDVSDDIVVVGDRGKGYYGPEDTQYILRVVEGGALGTAKIAVSDTKSIDVPHVITVQDGMWHDLGSYGLRVKITAPSNSNDWNGGLKKGDTYYVDAVSSKESTTQFDKLVLNGSAVDLTGGATLDIMYRVQLRKEFSGEVAIKSANGLNYTFESGTVGEGVTVYESLSEKIEEWPENDQYAYFVDGVGSLGISYRALVPRPLGTSYSEISSTADIVENHGVISDDNPLAKGALHALSGANGKSIYTIQTNGETLEDYADALSAVETTDLTYALVPMTHDGDIHEVLVQHCDAMSLETVKNFRKAYLGVKNPGSYPLIQKDSDDNIFAATVLEQDGQYIKVRCETINFNLYNLSEGDLLRINYTIDAFGDEQFETLGDTGDGYEVLSVLNENELLLKSGPSSPIFPAARFEIWKADTAESQADYIKQRGAAIGGRRGTNVWCDDLQAFDSDGNVEYVEPMYLAAEIAGIRTSLYPQQGMTNTEITSGTSAPNMYLRYSQSQLDEVAAAGTMITTQDLDSGEVYIRHQLTTETDKGSLYYEDNVAVNIDNISFKVKDALAGFIGKYNVNSRTIQKIKNVIEGILDAAVSGSGLDSVGPQILGYSDLRVEKDGVLQDRINVSFKVVIPLPLNTLTVEITGGVLV